MELLPPVGWADVATKHDLLLLESRMDLRFESMEHRFEATLERELRKVSVTMLSLFVTGFLATMVTVVLAVVLSR